LKMLDVTVLNPKNKYLHPWKCKLSEPLGSIFKEESGIDKEITLNKLSMGSIFKEESKSIDEIILTKLETAYVLKELKKKIKFINEVDLKGLSDYHIIKRMVDFLKCSDSLTMKNTYDLKPKTKQLLKKISLDKWYSHRLNESYKSFTRAAVSGFFEYLQTYLSERYYNPKAEERKIIIFSGHDTNIVDIFVNLLDHEYLKSRIKDALRENGEKAFDFLVPLFNSILLFELHEIDNSPYVRIIYNDKEIKGNIFMAKNIYEDDKGIPLPKFLEMCGQIVGKERLEC
jgi:hypothetical protein